MPLACQLRPSSGFWLDGRNWQGGKAGLPVNEGLRERLVLGKNNKKHQDMKHFNDFRILVFLVLNILMIISCKRDSLNIEVKELRFVNAQIIESRFKNLGFKNHFEGEIVVPIIVTNVSESTVKIDKIVGEFLMAPKGTRQYEIYGNNIEVVGLSLEPNENHQMEFISNKNLAGFKEANRMLKIEFLDKKGKRITLKHITIPTNPKLLE